MSAFSALHAACLALEARQRLETFQLHVAAAQGSEKSIKEMVKSYQEQAGIDARLGAADFNRKYSGGI